ncbi:binding-protein-dependent transport systems inner membrane component [Oscillochloris trichoides DG-6]|uniref:Binding-protein-dependent transport systems inner membrane component n=1 Tax=Oscillochloris trichoides DG-6 TaxID=765420 RepID=E1IFQ1_9CHLR|nr:binding-protein-dependent transport systems inner membrane component [Oscillochloris trichoides DG-6]
MVLWLLVLAAHRLIPQVGASFKVPADYLTPVALVVLGIFGVTFGIAYRLPTQRPRVLAIYRVLIVLGAVLIPWEVASRLAWIKPPFFPSPSKVIGVYIEDSSKLLLSIAYSMRLLVVGYLIGCIAGVSFGLALGWSRRVSNWSMFWIRLIGPIPATAWIPLAIVIFPNSFTAGVFLIAFASWFPVMMLTWSGVAGVPKALLEAAQTLGADEKRLLRQVVIPAALPSVFVGLFMSLGTAFAILIVAEMLGVKAGLGWYITWAQGWSEYHKVYAAMLVLGALFITVVSGIFKIRDRLLGWQKGILRW